MEILENICLVCLQTKHERISFFNKIAGTSPYEKVVKYTSFSIKPYDGPAWICKDCVNELVVVEKFVAKCEQSNEVLCDYFSHENDAVDIVTNKAAAINEEPECDDTCVNINDSSFERRDKPSVDHSPNKKSERVRRVCPVSGCHKSFTTKTNLSTHLRIHNGDRPFPCHECGKAFRSKNTLNNHMRIHTGIKPYICPTCGKQFSTNKLSAHMRTHAARTHTCAVCTRAFTHTRALVLHARTHAPPVRKYVCVACDVTYNHKQSLNKHVRKRHTQVRFFILVGSFVNQIFYIMGI
ncbi:zinc finger protein 79-like isoform X2 [Colias croceus]|uniref:zinc finger protein 79-like isoform X2 n=1 Tax=Colias crocea TaxID=72248 RepID=UPI001E280978|nr:zinc finger protein 79-like isoform X2 [Colias croceus]